LVTPAKADETTETLYRFKGNLAAGKASKLTVKQELIRGEEIAILPTDRGQLAFFAQAGEIPKPVREALAVVIAAKEAQFETERQVALRQQKIAEVTQEQNRIRENMKTVAEKSDYYNRLLKKLDEQETGIERLQEEVHGLQKKLEDQRAALEKSLNELSVG
jgi:septal ring factor EnvC (AmiA/AmiB activator)